MHATLQRLPYVLPWRTPPLVAGQPLRARQGWLLRLLPADPLDPTGLGEVAPLDDLPGFDAGTHAQADTQLAALPRNWEVPNFEDPLALGAWLDALQPDLLPIVRAGLYGAIADVCAQRVGRSLARWLDGRAVQTIYSNMTVTARDPAVAAAQSAAAVAAGVAAIKAKVIWDDGCQPSLPALLDGWHTALATRSEALLPPLRLRLDANGTFGDAPRALDRLRRLHDTWCTHSAAQSGAVVLDYLEQPTPARDLVGLMAVAAQSPVVIAADESLTVAPDAWHTLAVQGPLRRLVVKAAALGGADRVLTLVRALPPDAQVTLTTFLDGAVGRAAALHTAFALAHDPRSAGPHGLATATWLAQDVGHSPLDEITPAGAHHCDHCPGLGVVLHDDLRTSTAWQ